MPSHTHAALALIVVSLFVGCRDRGAQAEPAEEATRPTARAEAPAPQAPPEEPAPRRAEVNRARYAWLADWEGELPEMTTLEARFEPPRGFTRVAQPEASFGAWLRGLPVRLDRAEVRSYRGDALSSPSEAVVVLDVGERDLQQCADSALRLHAEYLWASDRADEAKYHFTSGDVSSWSKWARGERFKIEGRRVKPVMGKARGRSHAVYRGYLQHLFRYAGTRSLQFDSDPVSAKAHLAAGDFLVQPGGPGHAVMILDVAANAAGERVALIGQGFMPAQEFHVVRSGADAAIDGVWFRLPAPGDPEATIDTPSWRPFRRAEARRFK